MENVSQQQLSIAPEAASHLTSIRKWASFLSIMGFIASAFMVLFGFFFGAIGRTFGQQEFSGAISSIFIMFIYIVLGILYFFPSLSLFKFASNLKLALQSYTELQLTEAFKNLRSVFSFMGILTIVGIAVAVIGFAAVIVFSIIAAVAGNS